MSIRTLSQTSEGTKLALVFPGQGAQAQAMFAGIKHHPTFRRRYDLICDAISMDVIGEVERGADALLHRNMISSLMTALVCSTSFDLFQARHERVPDYLAGYSVGQWIALYVAQALTFADLVHTLIRRAQLMDGCIENVSCGMLGIIGVDAGRLEQLLAQLRCDGYPIYITNYNCFAHTSIGGTTAAMAQAEPLIRRLNPKKIVPLPVSGAWHCPLLADAARSFSAYLGEMTLLPTQIPIVDNVTAGWLPDADIERKRCLSRHLCEPVRWEQGIRHLISSGATSFVEVGYGTTLTKFGFFISRDVSSEPFYM